MQRPMNPALLVSVSSLPTREAFAAGRYVVVTNPPFGTESFALMLSWNGSAWVRQSTAQVGYYSTGAQTAFDVVAARAPNDVWAAGTAMLSTAGGLQAQAMVQHFDGALWRTVPLPVPSATYQACRSRRSSRLPPTTSGSADC